MSKESLLWLTQSTKVKLFIWISVAEKYVHLNFSQVSYYRFTLLLGRVCLAFGFAESAFQQEKCCLCSGSCWEIFLIGLINRHSAQPSSPYNMKMQSTLCRTWQTPACHFSFLVPFVCVWQMIPGNQWRRFLKTAECYIFCLVGYLQGRRWTCETYLKFILYECIGQN